MLSFARPWAFLREFTENPFRVGTLIGSSSFLSSRLIRLARVSHVRHLVELGAGSGSLTLDFLRALRPQATLTAIEISERLACCLRQIGDCRMNVHAGSAEHLSQMLKDPATPPDCIVSGIPFSTIPRTVGRRIVQEVWRNLAPGGRFVAYQFRPQVVHLAHDLLGPPTCEFEWFNLPPLGVYVWEKPQESSAAT